MKMNWYAVFVLAVVVFCVYAEEATNLSGVPQYAADDPNNPDNIYVNSFEHHDWLDIMYKLKGHNEDIWVVLLYIDEDHHKTERDRLKQLVFKSDNPVIAAHAADPTKPGVNFAEANISQSSYKNINIKLPANADADDYPMILVMRKQKGTMVYGPAAAKKASSIVAKLAEPET